MIILKSDKLIITSICNNNKNILFLSIQLKKTLKARTRPKVRKQELYGFVNFLEAAMSRLTAVFRIN